VCRPEGGEDKQVCTPEGGEDEREWDSKLTFLLATISCAVGLGNVWLFQYLSQNDMGGCYPCIIYCCHWFCGKVSSVHDMQCVPCIAITCVIHSCFITHNLVFSLAIHRWQEVVFLYHLAK